MKSKSNNHQTKVMRMTLTRTRGLVYDIITSKLRVDGAVVRDLETLLYADSAWQDNIRPMWSFFRLRNVRIQITPRHKYPYALSGTTYDGSVIGHVISVGHDYADFVAADNNVTVAEIVEQPKSKIGHSFDPNSLTATITDTKWYPVEIDSTTSIRDSVYKLFYLYSGFEIQEGASTVAVINIHFDLEFKGLRI